MSRLPFPLLFKANVQIVTSLVSRSAVTQLLKCKSYSFHVVGHHLFASGAADQGLGAGLTLIWNDKCWQRPESSVVQNPYFSTEKRNVWSDESSFTMFSTRYNKAPFSKGYKSFYSISRSNKFPSIVSISTSDLILHSPTMSVNLDPELAHVFQLDSTRSHELPSVWKTMGPNYLRKYLE